MRRLLLCLSTAVLLAGCSMLGLGQEATQPAATNTFVVYFDPATAELSPEAKLEVERAAATIKSMHPASVTIAGDPKTRTGKGFDPKLAEPRFNSVQEALIANGVDPKILARAMLTDLEVKADPSGNRRVEIRLYR